MRKESQDLLKQVDSDLKNAETLLKNEAYDLVAFLSHQIAEKSIKAYIIEMKEELPPKIHNLKELGDAADVPLELSFNLRDLTPHYIVSRYPSASVGVPAEIYTKETAEGLLKKAKEVLEWVRNSI
jgi:HEPN domain-containing protein